MNNKDSHQQTSIPKKIGLISAVIIGINAMIGAGIVAIPIVLSNQVGPAGIISCVLSAIAVMCIGISLGRATEIHPGEGWNYLYPSLWAGHKVGMISASCYVFGLVAGLGFLAQQIGVWFNSFAPIFSPSTFKFTIMIILMLLTLAGTKTSSLIQNLIVVFVIVPLVATSIFCWFNFDYNLVTPFMPYGISSVLKASSNILFALIGFESIISLYSVIKNPQKNIPLAFILSIGTVAIIYLLFFYGVLFSIPKEFFAKGLNDTLSNILSNAFPSAKILSSFVLIGAIFGILGTLHSLVWSVSILLSNVVKRAKLKTTKCLLEKNIWNNNVSLFITTALILLSSIIIKNEDLIYLTVLFVAISYILSIAFLLFQKEEWLSKRNIITILGILGGLLIIYFALQNTFLAFYGFWG